eukprot:1965825-Rhodomonas_salina.4
MGGRGVCKTWLPVAEFGKSRICCHIVCTACNPVWAPSEDASCQRGLRQQGDRLKASSMGNKEGLSCKASMRACNTLVLLASLSEHEHRMLMMLAECWQLHSNAAKSSELRAVGCLAAGLWRGSSGLGSQGLAAGGVLDVYACGDLQVGASESCGQRKGGTELVNDGGVIEGACGCEVGLRLSVRVVAMSHRAESRIEDGHTESSLSRGFTIKLRLASQSGPCPLRLPLSAATHGIYGQIPHVGVLGASQCTLWLHTHVYAWNDTSLRKWSSTGSSRSIMHCCFIG